jgi:hypothetical protein
MSQRTEPREVFKHFGGHLILGAADFSDTLRTVLNPGATEIDGRIAHPYDGAVDAGVCLVGARRARAPRHLAQPPGPLGPPPGRTTGTA